MPTSNFCFCISKWSFAMMLFYTINVTNSFLLVSVVFFIECAVFISSDSAFRCYPSVNCPELVCLLWAQSQFISSFSLKDFNYKYGRRCCNTFEENKIMDIRRGRTKKKELPQREGCPNYHQRMRLVELAFLLQNVVKKNETLLWDNLEFINQN